MTNVLPIDSVWAFLGLIFGFGFIIFVHELGHFLVAKAVDIKCLQFAIGFGHALLAYRKGIGVRVGSTETEYEQRLADGADPATLGETEYRLCWLPLGGYVKMLGQDDMNPASTSQDPRSFTAKPIWARACVISAGVVMNVIFAVVFFIAAFTAGVQFPPAIVGNVEPQMPAGTAFATGHEGNTDYQGLEPGDKITHIDGEPATDFMQVAIRTALSARGATRTLTIEREGVKGPLQYSMAPTVSSFTNLLSLGIRPPKGLDVLGTFKGDTLDVAGVKPDMTITTVAGQPVSNYGQVNRLIAAAHGLPVPVTFTDATSGETVEAAIHAESSLMRAADGPSHLLGLVPATQVNLVIEKSPAEGAGFQAGDVIAAIDNVSWPHAAEVTRLVQQSGERPLKITVLRDGQMETLDPVAAKKKRIGIVMVPYFDEPLVATTLPESPAAPLELTRGSMVSAINGEPVANWRDLQRALQDHAAAAAQADGPIVLTIAYELNVKDRPAAAGVATLDADTAAALLAARWVDPLDRWLSDLRVPIKGDDPLDAMVLGIEKTHQIMAQTYLTLARLIQGTIKVSHLRGPVGIVHEGTKIARQGWTYLMFFLGLISVNLAVINFLPIPIVDGGLMIFLLVEKLKGTPVSPRIHVAATVVGLALIASVFLLTLFYDTARLMQW